MLSLICSVALLDVFQQRIVTDMFIMLVILVILQMLNLSKSKAAGKKQ